MEVGNYIENLFLNPRVSDEFINSAGKDFYLKSYEVINSDISNWNDITKAIGEKTSKKGKELFMPLRVAITGQTYGPELDKVFDLIGKDKVLERLKEVSEL